MDNKNLKGLSEAYNDVYSDEYYTQVEEYTKDIFLVLSESLIQQGYSAVDVLEYFNEVEEETILKDFISLIDGDILTESVVPEFYIQEQYDILAEGIASALISGAQKVGTRLPALASKITPRAASALSAGKKPIARAASNFGSSSSGGSGTSRVSSALSTAGKKSSGYSEPFWLSNPKGKFASLSSKGSKKPLGGSIRSLASRQPQPTSAPPVSGKVPESSISKGGKVLKGIQGAGEKIVTSLKGKINPQAISAAVKNAPRAASLAGKVLKAGVQGARYPASASPSGLTGKIGNAIGGPRVASALSAAKTSLGRSIQQGGGTLKGAVKNSPAMGGKLLNTMKSAASNVKNVASSALGKVKGSSAAANTAAKSVGGGIKSTLGRLAGPAIGAAIDTANEKSSGSGWGRSLAKGAIGAIGTGLGAAAGTAVAPGAGTLAGGMAGNYAAGKAFDVAAGANAKDRAQMANKNRSSQAGGKIVGTGGNLTVNKAKNAITTGVGPNRKTVGLSKTQAINTPGKGQETGYLAYKGGKPVYKRAADPSTLSKTSSNAFERIGRTFNPNAYKASDTAAKSATLKTAQANTATYKKNLGVKEDFEYWVDSLFDEGYDLSNYTWEGLFEVYCEEFELDETLANPSTAADFLNNNRNRLPPKPTAGRGPEGPLWDMPGDSKVNPTTGAKPAPTTGITAASKPSPAKSSPAKPSPFSRRPGTFAPVNSSTVKLSPQQIKAGTQTYNAQRASGDMKGAASTGMGVWKNANPTLAAKPKTSYNPLMNKTFGYQTGNSPKDISKANGIVSSGQVAALKPATPAPTPATPIAAAVKPATPTPQRRTPTRAPILQMNSYDFGKPDRITQDVASLYQSIYEGKKKIDQDKDGDNDFADVQIAKMIASGMSKEEAIRKVRNKSYNEETELDEGRTEELKRKYTAKYGKLEYPTDTLRLNKTRRAYEKASRDNQDGYGKNPRTAIKGKQNLGQAMYKAGQSARVINAEFELWVNELLDEGYDLSDYTWNELYGNYQQLDEISIALKRRAADASVGKVKAAQERFNTDRTSNTAEYLSNQHRRAVNQHKRLVKAAYPSPQAKKANELKSQKKNLEKAFQKENYDAYNLVIGHLLDEGFADDYDSANMMIERMSDEWLNEILESKN